MGENAKYMGVYRAIKADILSEKIPAGTMLPTERELMAQYGASRTTIRHAVAMLRDEQIVEVRQGRGTKVLLQSRTAQSGFVLFHNVTGVSNSFQEDEQSATVRAQGGVITLTAADRETAEALAVAEGTEVYRMERLFLVDGRPFTYQITHLRRELVPDFARYSGRIDLLCNLYKFLEDNYGIYFTTGQETISAIAAGLFDAKVLDVAIGAPLLAFRRTAYCEQGTLEYAKLLTVPEGMNITVSMSGPPTFYH